VGIATIALTPRLQSFPLSLASRYTISPIERREAVLYFQVENDFAAHIPKR
jgi:hypothetical protein